MRRRRSAYAILHSARRFVTYRRFLLDEMLSRYDSNISGTVLDVGGKNKDKRGTYRPSENHARDWFYLNTDPTTSPDIIADAALIPFRDSSVDTVLCCELLEHLREPLACISEIHRVLRPGGCCLASAPFLYPIHNDPKDYGRFSREGLRVIFGGFDTIDIMEMGSVAGTLGMLVELAGNRRWLPIRLMFKALGRALCIFEMLFEGKDQSVGRPPCYTTGYFVVAQKRVSDQA